MHRELGTQPHISKLQCTPLTSCPLFNSHVLVSKREKKKKKESYVCAVQHFAVMIRGSQLLPGNVEIPGRKQPPAAFVLSEQKYVLAVNG